MENLTQLFTLLSEPVRLQILGRLASGEQCVCKMFGALGLPQSTVSRHLALLRSAKLVAARRKGTWMHYRLTPETYPEAWRAVLEIVIADAAARVESQDNESLCQPAERKSTPRAIPTAPRSGRYVDSI